MVCGVCQSFTLLSRRRHHCRMCGCLYCHACCSQRILGREGGRQGGRQGGGLLTEW